MMKKRKIACLLLIFAATMLAVPASQAYYYDMQYGEELIQNGSFDESTNGWTFSGGQGEWLEDEEQGGYVKMTANGLYPSVTQQVAGLEGFSDSENRNFELSFKMKGDAVHQMVGENYGTVALEYPQESNGKKNYYFYLTGPEVTAQWNTYTVSIPYTGGIGVPKLYVRANVIEDEGGFLQNTYYVDDFSLKETSQAVFNEHNLLENDNFSNGIQGWTITQEGTAEAQGNKTVLVKGTKEAVVNNDFPSLRQDGLIFQAGHSYRISATFQKVDDGAFLDTEGAILYAPGLSGGYMSIGASNLQQNQWYTYTKDFFIGEEDIESRVEFRVNTKEYYAKDLKVLDMTETPLENVDFDNGLEAWIPTTGEVTASEAPSEGINNSPCVQMTTTSASTNRGIKQNISPTHSKEIFSSDGVNQYLISVSVRTEPGKTGKAAIRLNYDGKGNFIGKDVEVGEDWTRLIYLFDFHTSFAQIPSITADDIMNVQILVQGKVGEENVTYYVDNLEILPLQPGEIYTKVFTQHVGNTLTAKAAVVNNRQTVPEDDSIAAWAVSYGNRGDVYGIVGTQSYPIYSCQDYYNGKNIEEIPFVLTDYVLEESYAKLLIWEGGGNARPYTDAIILEGKE